MEHAALRRGAHLKQDVVDLEDSCTAKDGKRWGHSKRDIDRHF